MTSERSVGVVWSEETENGVTLHMRVGTGADVMLTLPNASVAAQAEAQLRSVLAMATMQFQRVAKETTSGGTLWEGFMPEETKAHIAEQAEALVKTISDGRLDRPLLSDGSSHADRESMEEAAIDCVQARDRADRRLRTGAGQPMPDTLYRPTNWAT